MELQETLKTLEVDFYIVMVLFKLILWMVEVGGEWNLKVSVNQKLVVVVCRDRAGEREAKGEDGVNDGGSGGQNVRWEKETEWVGKGWGER